MRHLDDSTRSTELVDPTTTYEGVVKWFSVARGYGFVSLEAPTPVAEDILLHHSELANEDLEPGDRVRFSLVVGPRGLVAREVSKVAAR